MPWPLSAVNSGPRRLSQAHGITETCRNSQPTCSAASCSSPADRPDVQSQAQNPLFFGDQYIWPGLKATTAHEPGDRSHQRAYEQARVMGGGSSINVQAANRGLPRDYDEWAELGADGWSWTEVLPYFRRLESDLNFAGPLHGVDGPIPIRRIMPEQWPPFGHAVAKAFAASGLPRRLDQNGEFEDGIFPPTFSNREDQRVSTATAYLDAPTRARSNLEIAPTSLVTKLFVSGRRAEGLAIRRKDGTTRRVRAR